MPIQPLSQVKSAAMLHFYPPDIMTVRPRLAPLIAECIAEWAQIECTLGIILAVILETEAQTGLAMYMSLTSLSNQMTVVSAAAKAKLTVADEELFSAVLMVVKSAAKDRHKFAHWCWALSDDLPDALLLLDPAYQAPLLANWLGLHDPLTPVDRDHIYVLREQDGKDIVSNMKMAKKHLYSLINVLHVEDRAVRAERRQKLSSEPQILEALGRLRKARRSGQEAPE
jgi:hypothetical protein